MLFGQTATAPAAGDGTSENPYQIASLENLYWISQYSTEWSKYYIQTADIDASATSGWSGGGWTPIGSGATPYFSGSYNGQGHTISGLYILRSVQFQGLFGKTSGATIQNLGVTAVFVQAPSYIGGLIGACNFSTVSNCYSSGQTRADGSHTNTKLGGLIGIVEGSSTVSNCYSTANVQTSNKENGGFAGEINGATVSNCYSKGLVTGTGGSNGGFVGTVTSATVTNCFWDTQTSGKISSAAGTGKTTAQMKDYTTFTGWDFIIETDNGSNNFWDMDQLVTVNNGYPILTWQTGTDNILAYSGGLGTSGDPYQIFTLSDLSSLTQRSIDWNKYYNQTANINALSTQYWDDADDNSDGDKYNDPNDATSTGNNEGFSPIGNGSTHFTGSFNGQGFAIDGLYMNRPATSYMGLFGSASAATIQNLGVTNINFTGAGNVGGIAGYTLTSGTISNCYATGTIAADNDHIGGLVGYNWKANISRCYANVAVTVSGNRNYTGGLVGINTEATIQDCYRRGAVAGYNYVGGLVGSHTISALIDKCYSIGAVTGTSNTGGIVGYNNSTVTSSFWNSDINAVGIGGGTTTGATGKTTAEMTDQSTFLNAGWSSAIWNIGDGINDGYPYLDWQNPGGTPLPVELTSFTAATSSAPTGSASVTLNWTTATEVNNYGFEIQRSVVNNQRSEWKKIGFVEGNGNSNSPKDYSFIDENVSAGNCLYRLKQIDYNGGFSYSSEVEINVEAIPTEFALYQNYPNPFNPSTTIKFGLPLDSHVTLEVFNILGEKVVMLINQRISAGIHNYQLSTDNYQLTSGTYIYQLRATNQNKTFTDTKKMLFIK
jgi:hypothetical protein